MREEEDFDSNDYSIDAWRRLPVFQKAESILKLVEHILEGIPKEEFGGTTQYEYALYEHHAKHMMENALLIPAKIAGADSVELYDIKMENAAIIRKAAREIITDTSGLEMSGYTEIEYLDLLRKEIEEFRPLFARWVQTFDITNYLVDRWGLFNPPGINYNDPDF